MEFKQETIGDIIESEREAFLRGTERYGDYFVNAYEFNDLIQNCIKSIDRSCEIFAIFLGQVRRQHLLALFSTIRLHRIQAMMDLRQVLEAGAWAAYAIAHPDYAQFCEMNKTEIVSIPKKLVENRNMWLETGYKEKSDFIKKMKGLINSSTAHSNIVYSFRDFVHDQERKKFGTAFFDIEDDYIVKGDLWMIGNIALGLLDLFYGINKPIGVVKFSEDFIPRLTELERVNVKLKNELMDTDRYRNSLKLPKS